MSTALMKVERGVTARENFSGGEIQRNAETALAAVTARERAATEALYIVAERHPRNWLDVRSQMLAHCERSRFAEVSRYKRPAGRKKINNQWVDTFAEGFSTRFTEVLAQEMGNIQLKTQVTYEDDLIRIVRISALDLQKNVAKDREVAIAKTVERRGKKKADGEWDPPEGREVISVRTNSYGEPTFLVRATDDELRAKTNAEESKSQRDMITRLCPRDILEDCEDKILQVLSQADQRDPQAANKKLLDDFAKFGIKPSDLEQYLGKPAAQFRAAERRELFELGVAIKEGHTSFDEAMRLRYLPPESDETDADRDARNQRNLNAQDEAARRRIEELEAHKAGQKPTGEPTTEQSQEATADTTTQNSTSNEGEKQEPQSQSTTTPQFGQKPQQSRGFGRSK